jgi:hypothetical protein
VARPELREQLVVRDDLRVEVDCEGLRMITDALVRRIGLLATGIADARADDSSLTPEPGIGGPESTESEDRRFGDGLDHVEWLLIDHDRHASIVAPMCSGGSAAMSTRAAVPRRSSSR